eukprot:133481_1
MSSNLGSGGEYKHLSSGIKLDSIFNQASSNRCKTKIICTLGPACWSVEMLGKLIDAGMNVARLNFSHGDHTTHAETLTNLRRALLTRRDKHVAVMLDTKGPEIRTGRLSTPKVDLVKGQTLELTTDYTIKGDSTKLACSYKSLPTTVQPGSSILVADGSLVLTVKECKKISVICEVMNNCTIGEHKNMNLPNAVVDLPTLTEKDKSDIVNFGIPQGIDFVAASFVRKPEDIDNIRAVLGKNSIVKIIAKIENQEGIKNYDAILEKTDCIMVARGDMGMEIPPEKVFIAQKYMIHRANIIGKPVVTATQMLESMIHNPRPTRAECSDVANAVIDGTDCVMLSGETANGEYPEQAVQIMERTCMEAENSLNNDELYQAVRNTVLSEKNAMRPAESVASSAVKTAFDTKAAMIVVLTETGTTARLIAKYRPSMPILAFTGLEETARQCNGLLRNVSTKCIGSMIGTDSILVRAIDVGKARGWVHSGDAVVCVHGFKEASAGSTNSLRVLTA